MPAGDINSTFAYVMTRETRFNNCLANRYTDKGY